MNNENTDLKGKVVIITGANAGLGKDIAKKLAKQNAHIIMACRNEKKAKEAVQEVKDYSNNQNIEYMLLDLLSLESVKNFAKLFKERNLPCHLLINNAGIMWLWENKTDNPPITKCGAQSFNTQFLANYLSHFLLTQLLFDILMENSARILNISSSVHQLSSFNVNNLVQNNSYTFSTYCQSKAAQILSTYAMQKRIDQQKQQQPNLQNSATVNAIHPGIFASEIVNLPPPLKQLYHTVFKSSEYCSRAIVKVATDPKLDGIGGKYFDDGHIIKSSSFTYKDELAEELWSKSMELIKDYI
eukprot:gene435-550_t